MLFDTIKERLLCFEHNPYSMLICEQRNSISQHYSPEVDATRQPYSLHQCTKKGSRKKKR